MEHGSGGGKSEAECRKSEIGGQRADFRGQTIRMLEVGGGKAEARCRKSEVGNLGLRIKEKR